MTAPGGAELMSRRMPIERIDAAAALGKSGGRSTTRCHRAGPDRRHDHLLRSMPTVIDIGPSRFATPSTYVEFEGATAYGDSSRMPFHVSSADWQESDRLLAGTHDRVRQPDQRDSDRRLRHVRRRDAEQLLAPAHRRDVRRRADARLRRRVGRREGIGGHREQLRRREGRRHHGPATRRSSPTGGSRSAIRAATTAKRSTPGSASPSARRGSASRVRAR